MAFDPRITNSEGAEFSNQIGRVIYANSHGFAGEYSGSTFGHSVAPVASQDGAMQRDYWYSSNRKFSRLGSPESVGERAAQRVLRRLGGRKVKTCDVPIVFDPEMAASLLRNLASAISGYSLYKGASFLAGKLDTQIGSESSHRDRRRHDPGRAWLATVRRRRIADPQEDCRRKRPTAKLLARYLQRQKARNGIHRQRLSLGRRAARGFAGEFLSGARQGLAGANHQHPLKMVCT